MYVDILQRHHKPNGEALVLWQLSVGAIVWFEVDVIYRGSVHPAYFITVAEAEAYFAHCEGQ